MMKHRYLFVVVGLCLPGTAAAQSPKQLYVEAGTTEADRKVVACLPEKLREYGAFAFVPKDEADAVLTLRAKVPSIGRRVLLGSIGGAAEVQLRARRRDGTLLWEGKNKYKKGSTSWGAGTDVACGLANGIAKKFAAEVW